MNKKKLKQIVQLQLIIIIYTLAGIMAKFASMEEALTGFGLYFALDLGFLGIYAIFWQQLIKVFPLSVAYANRALSLLWSALWAKIIFGEQITLKQGIAIGIVIIGIILVNGDKDDEQ